MQIKLFGFHRNGFLRRSISRQEETRNEDTRGKVHIGRTIVETTYKRRTGDDRLPKIIMLWVQIDNKRSKRSRDTWEKRLMKPMSERDLGQGEWGAGERGDWETDGDLSPL